MTISLTAALLASVVIAILLMVFNPLLDKKKGKDDPELFFVFYLQGAVFWTVVLTLIWNHFVK